MKLVTRLVRDLLPGDKVHDFFPPARDQGPGLPLPWTILETKTQSDGLVALAYRVRRQRATTPPRTTMVPGHHQARVQARRRPRIVQNPDRLFHIRNKVTGEQLQAKELTRRGPNGERLYQILWARTRTDKTSWSDDYTDLRFQETLGQRWEVLP